MTTQQKLQIVSERIRKDIPRLMELREGCLVQNNDNKEIEIFLGYLSNDEKNTILKDYETGEIWIDYQNYFWINEHEDYAYSIIGHEIMLNDVLEWLKIMFSKNSDDKRIPTALNFNGMFFRNDYDKEL